MLLFSSSLVFAAGVPNSFKSLTGSGKANVIYDFETWATKVGSFNFNLSNLRVPDSDYPEDKTANFSFTLKVPISNKQNQQGNYNGYDVVYAIVNVNDPNASVFSTVMPGVALTNEPTGFMVRSYVGMISIIGDGNLIEKKTNVEVLLLAIDSRDKNVQDQLWVAVDEKYAICQPITLDPVELPSSAIVTNVYSIRNQNQQ
jgi:hypothetical protein